MTAMHTGRARELAQHALTDVVACIIAGSSDVATQAVTGVSQRFGKGTALAMGTDLRLPAPWAALVSGTAAHALDFDDNFAPAFTHATAVLAPALFALADEERLSGARIIDAYIVGLELQARIGRFVNPFHYERGWHATSTVGVIGTAGGCARLLGLDAVGIQAAMSVSASMAAGSKKQFGSMMKPIHAGMAAKNAVLAARFAQAGVCGDPEPLSGHWGFLDLFGDRQKETIAERLALDGLGTTLVADSEGLLFKRFPCCGAAHRTLDGIADLRERHGIALEEVDHIEASIPAFARSNLRFDDPQDAMQARFSLTYCGSRVLQTGTLKLGDLVPGRIGDSVIRESMRRFRIRVEPGSAAELCSTVTPVKTRITLRHGEIYEVEIASPKGSRQLPFSQTERRAKFDDCCEWAGKAHAADHLFKVTEGIHELTDFADFSSDFCAHFRSTSK